ncbi:MAG: sensor histidine kinase [Desulfobacterales bacterium]
MEPAPKTENGYRSIRNTILACMIVVPMISLLLILGIGFYYFSHSIQSHTVESMHRITQDHADMIDSFLAERRTDLQFILNTYSFSELTASQTLERVYRDLKKKSSAFTDLGIFNEEGVHVAYQGPYSLVGKVYRDAEWFRQVNEKGVYISDIFLGVRNIPHYIIAISGTTEEGRWIIRATIDTLMFSNLVQRVRIGWTGEAYILDKNGLLQTERRSGGRLMEKSGDEGLAGLAPDASGTFIAKDASGTRFVYATSWLNGKRWRLVVRQQVSDAFSALRTAAYLIVLTTVVAGSLIAWLAFYLTGRIVGRIEKVDAEKAQLGEQLIRAARLAELGEMATGVAHEINNPLQIIKGEQTLIEMNFDDLRSAGKLPQDESMGEIADSLQQIRQQIDRCAHITQAILKFGRKTESHMEPVPLQRFIPEVIGMVEKKAEVHGIHLLQDIDPACPQVSGDPSQLQQVLLNLFNNAIDAILERHGTEGGRLDVTAGLRDGKVAICVGDNGAGIKAENVEKVFSPFFTTKPVGKGTGLGLSVCYGIISQMGGVMKVDSESGVGTRFTILLPPIEQTDGFGNEASHGKDDAAARGR